MCGTYTLTDIYTCTDSFTDTYTNTHTYTCIITTVTFHNGSRPKCDQPMSTSHKDATTVGIEMRCVCAVSVVGVCLSSVVSASVAARAHVQSHCM